MSSPETDQGAADLDLEARELCPDGACVGVIGPDGRCKVCGRAGEGGRGAPAGPPADAVAERPRPSLPEDDDGSGFDDERRLCPDGACVGIIGSDGRCKVCGKVDSV